MLLTRLAGALQARGLSLVADDTTEDLPRTQYQRRQDREIAESDSRNGWSQHRCGPDCMPAPYSGPILLGRRGEPITEGRPS
jgi:hypothetical protein